MYGVSSTGFNKYKRTSTKPKTTIRTVYTEDTGVSNVRSSLLFGIPTV